jgi:hypothetical protein
MAALQGSGAVMAKRGIYPRSSSEVEALKLLIVGNTAFADIPPPSYTRTQLGVLTAGTRVSSKMNIRGGVL